MLISYKHYSANSRLGKARSYLAGGVSLRYLVNKTYKPQRGESILKLKKFRCFLSLPLEELVKLLSKKTLDIMGDFVDEYLGLGPEFSEVPQDFPVLI